MLALSPPLFSTSGWPLEDTISHDHDQEGYHMLKENKLITSESYSSFLHFAPPLSPFPDLQADFDPLTPSTTPISCDPTMVRKISHNASERDRRKKINSLYSTLRSLLPAADQTKKLSIPATVSRALRYIPELQQQVQNLIQQKEELLSRVDCKEEAHKQRKKRSSNLLQNHVVSASKLSEKDAVIHIVDKTTNNKVPPTPSAALSEVLFHLEKYRIPVVNASTFESFEGKVFHTLHVQVERELGLECDALAEMVLNLFSDNKPPPADQGVGVPQMLEHFMS